MDRANVVTIDRFEGVDLNRPAIQLDLAHTDSCKNVYTRDGGQVRKRPGISDPGIAQAFLNSDGIAPTTTPRAIWDIIPFRNTGDSWLQLWCVARSTNTTGAASDDDVHVWRRPYTRGYSYTYPLGYKSEFANYWNDDNNPLNPVIYTRISGTARTDPYRKSRLVMGRTGVYRNLPYVTGASVVATYNYAGGEVATPVASAMARQQDCVAHKNHIMAIGGETSSDVELGNRLLISTYDSMTGFPTANANLIDPVGSMRWLTGMKSAGELVYIGATHGYYGMSGSTIEDFRVEHIPMKCGTLMGRAAITTGPSIVCPSMILNYGFSTSVTVNQRMSGIIDGFVMLQGMEYKHIGEAIRPTLMNSTIKSMQSIRGGIIEYENLALWLLRPTGAFVTQVAGGAWGGDNADNQNWLALSLVNSSWWPWETARYVGANCLASVDGGVMMGTNDGKVRYFALEEPWDHVCRWTGGASSDICYSIESFYKSAPISKGDGTTLSLEWISLEGVPGAQISYTLPTKQNPLPGPNVRLSVRSDLTKQWQVVGSFPLTPSGDRISTAGKVDAGVYLEVKVEFPTDYYGCELRRIQMGIRGLGRDIPSSA